MTGFMQGWAIMVLLAAAAVTARPADEGPRTARAAPASGLRPNHSRSPEQQEPQVDSRGIGSSVFDYVIEDAVVTELNGGQPILLQASVLDASSGQQDRTDIETLEEGSTDKTKPDPKIDRPTKIDQLEQMPDVNHDISQEGITLGRSVDSPLVKMASIQSQTENMEIQTDSMDLAPSKEFSNVEQMSIPFAPLMNQQPILNPLWQQNQRQQGYYQVYYRPQQYYNQVQYFPPNARVFASKDGQRLANSIEELQPKAKGIYPRAEPFPINGILNPSGSPNSQGPISWNTQYVFPFVTNNYIPFPYGDLSQGLDNEGRDLQLIYGDSGSEVMRQGKTIGAAEEQDETEGAAQNRESSEPADAKFPETEIVMEASGAPNKGGPFITRLLVRRGGVAIAGPGGVATAGSGGTAIVGPGGVAYARPNGLSIVGPGGKVVSLPVGQTEPRSGEALPPGARVVAVGPTVYFHPPELPQ